ncbi:pili assembly chaperone, PapD N-terminal domain [Candidatus Vecturithrix granuli]|uniref:Pili assembly chaperone, PapD N-terminal domain n=1 Tax=Vecturithrix granuli TaxID=1499967 RepID=A0A081C655_VECG1|nr:pili assembly chaperone, PapD N-terminal domain [Candidatus Vecturithrix granuli]
MRNKQECMRDMHAITFLLIPHSCSFKKERMKIWRILNILVFLMLAWYSGNTLAQAPAGAIEFGISPSLFQLTIGAQNKTESFRVFNFGARPMKFQISVHNWEVDEAFNVQVIPPTEQSLDQWIVINPVEFTVAPGKSQVVRFAIRPRVQPEPGEHRAILYTCEVPIKTENQSQSNIVGCIGAAVYGDYGEISRIGILHDVTLVSATNPVLARFDISSEGNAHVRMDGQYAIWKASAYPGTENTTRLEDMQDAEKLAAQGIADAGVLPSLPVLPGTRRTMELQTSMVLAPGEYVLDINGSLSGNAIDQGIPFSIPK